MPKVTIAQLWKSFEQECVPTGASQVQRNVTKLAFYGGATSLFTAIVDSLDSGTEATDADLNLMADIERELREFAGAQKETVN